MKNFEALGLNGGVLDAIQELGYVDPTEIQEQAIPLLVDGTTDFIGLAQTGTGKTAAFGLPLIQLINPMSTATQALIIAPTRELCMQIHSDLESYAKHDDISIAAVYGGADQRQQIRQLNKGAQIICATPGRLMDFIKRGKINTAEITHVVLDEADEMLNMGFYDDIQFILSHTPARESTWLFSATMPEEIRKIAKDFMDQPVEVTAAAVNSTNADIEHQYYVAAGMKRKATLERIIDYYPEMYGIIFTRTKRDAKDLAEYLLQQGYKSDALHGDLLQDQRDVVMGRFRNGGVRILVATDVAARGIDIAEISHVINFELPEDPEVYTHRSGRTGRAGNKGLALSIVQNREISKIRQIEKISKAKFKRVEIPGGKDILSKRLHYLAQNIREQEPSSLQTQDLDMLRHQLADIDRDQLIDKFVAMHMQGDIDKYKKARDLNASNFKEKERSGDRTSIFINVGTKDGFNDKSFRQWIQDCTEIPSDLIYRVRLKDIVSFFDVEASAAKSIIDMLHNQKFQNRKLRLDISDRQDRKRSSKPQNKPNYKGPKGKKPFRPKRR